MSTESFDSFFNPIYGQGFVATLLIGSLLVLLTFRMNKIDRSTTYFLLGLNIYVAAMWPFMAMGVVFIGGILTGIVALYFAATVLMKIAKTSNRTESSDPAWYRSPL